ncbi:MAG TPA: hypothetical protein VFF06_33205 [Polyangia bacterium]|nr:hypothetical protein [Polyangia bacterium]
MSLLIAMAGCNQNSLTQPPMVTGAIVVDSATFFYNGATRAGSSVQAFFHGPTQSGCSQSTVGSCVVTRCDSTDAGAPPSTARPSAGVVTIAGGSQQVVLTPQADGTYAPFLDASHGLWTGGEALSVTAAGGDVPGFTDTLTRRRRSR